jgi:hypothetical protein
MTSDEQQVPTVEEYRRAFQATWPDLTDEQKGMLRAHFQAPTLTLSAVELAEAGGYGPNYRTANLQYGRVGTLIAAAIGFTGTPALLSMVTLSHPDGEHWRLELRPQAVKALAEMDLFAERSAEDVRRSAALDFVRDFVKLPSIPSDRSLAEAMNAARERAEAILRGTHHDA